MDHLDNGIKLFNEDKFFATHEAWENNGWRRSQNHLKSFSFGA